MKRISIIVCMALVTATGFKSAAQSTATALTLRQCVEAGIANNLDVQKSGLLLQTSRINWNQARLNMLPDLNGTASSGIQQGRSIDPFSNTFINQQVNFSSYGVSSGVTLFNGFSLQNSAKQYSLAYEAARMDYQQAKDNLTINIILAYLQVLSNEDQLTQSRNQADLSKQQVDRLEIMNKEGAIAPALLFDLRGQYANDQLGIISAQNALETSKVNLSQLMNVPYDKAVSLERLDPASYASRYDDTPDKIYQEALQKFALVKAVELRRRSAEKGVKVARGQLFPILSLNGNVNTNYSSAATQDVFLGQKEITSADYVVVDNDHAAVIRTVDDIRRDKINYGHQLNNNLFSAISLDLRIPLFNAFRQRNQVKLAKITLKNNELEAQTTKTQLQQSIEQAYVNMTSASDRFKTLLEQVDAFTESFKAAEVKFNSGVGTSVDYLTAKNNLDRANLNLISARYDYVLRTRILDYYQGKPLW